MTFTTMVLWLFGRRITLADRMLIQSAYNLDTLSGLVRLTMRILKVTLCLEGLGAVGSLFHIISKRRSVFLSLSSLLCCLSYGRKFVLLSILRKSRTVSPLKAMLLMTPVRMPCSPRKARNSWMPSVGVPGAAASQKILSISLAVRGSSMPMDSWGRRTCGISETITNAM